MNQRKKTSKATVRKAAAGPAVSVISQAAPMPERQPYRVRLPGFVVDEEIGLGDAIKRVSYAVGIKPCGGCSRRAAALNRWLTFGPTRGR